MANEINFGAVLANLKAQRDALDRVIDGLERWLALGAVVQSRMWEIPPDDSAATISKSVVIGTDSFARMSLPDAIHKYLRTQRTPPPPLKDITNALRQGGFQSTSKDLKRLVSATLTRLKNERHTVVQRDDGWALASSTGGENTAGTHRTSSVSRNRKLPHEQVEAIKSKNREGKSYSMIAREVGVSRTSVYRVLKDGREAGTAA